VKLSQWNLDLKPSYQVVISWLSPVFLSPTPPWLPPLLNLQSFDPLLLLLLGRVTTAISSHLSLPLDRPFTSVSYFFPPSVHLNLGVFFLYNSSRVFPFLLSFLPAKDILFPDKASPEGKPRLCPVLPVAFFPGQFFFILEHVLSFTTGFSHWTTEGC